MKGKVFLVSELFYPNKTSTAYIMTEIANKFANSGKIVEVITTDIKYDTNITDKKYSYEFEISRIKTIKGNKNNTFFRIFSAVYNGIIMNFKIFKNVKKDDIVFAVTNPFIMILFLACIRNIKNFRFVLLVHDIFPENTVAAGLLSKESIINKLLTKIFNWSYQQADQLIVLGGDMKNVLEKKGVSGSSIEIIHNWYDSDIEKINSIDRNDYFKQDLSDKIVIGFAGNVGRVQNLEGFLSMFVKSTNPNLVCCIIGEGACLAELKNKFSEQNIHFVGPKPRNEQNIFLNTFDIGLITLGVGMYGLGVPSKTYNLISIGKPILYIGDRFSEIDNLINENHLGWSFRWNTEDDIIKFLNELSFKDLEQYDIVSAISSNYRQNEILNKLTNVVFDQNDVSK